LARVAATSGLIAAALAVPGGIAIAGHAIADAYLQVSVFVAATLVVLYPGERLFRTDFGEFLAHNQAWQVPAGALLGGLPGCGGAIVAVTQFTRGRISFGGVVATLTTTMGDAVVCRAEWASRLMLSETTDSFLTDSPAHEVSGARAQRIRIWNSLLTSSWGGRCGLGRG
jgi:hypothetical protein